MNFMDPITESEHQEIRDLISMHGRWNDAGEGTYTFRDRLNIWIYTKGDLLHVSTRDGYCGGPDLADKSSLVNRSIRRHLYEKLVVEAREAEAEAERKRLASADDGGLGRVFT